MTIKKESIEALINDMLKENTGIHFLDSGMENNRAWQKNQNKDFDKEPKCSYDAYCDDNIIFDISTYHFLINHLEVTEQSEKYNKMFYAQMDKDTPYLREMEVFAGYFESEGITNTYNFENLLSQVLQYTIFRDNEEDYYIILQIHGGCDVRGGYTKPHIFKILDFDYFCIHMTDIELTDKKTNNTWYSDDTGYNFYPSYKEHELKIKVKNGKIYDSKTNNPLTVGVYW